MDQNARARLDVQARGLGIDLDGLLTRHEGINAGVIAKYREIMPRAEGGIAEFHFAATGNAKRRLLRRNLVGTQKRRGKVSCREAISFNWLTYCSVLYALTAKETGTKLVSWQIVVSPNSK